MFNINRLITKIKESDKNRDAPSPPQVNLPGASSTESNDDTTEGFLCPSCMDGFSTPEELQKHYEARHSDGSHHTCPICKGIFPTSDQLQIHYMGEHTPMGANHGDIKAMKEELAELQTTLKEERWYSDELKREVQRLSGAVSKENSEEVDLYKHQLKALEESKHLLTSEVVLLRKQLGEAVEMHAAVKTHKENVEQKLDALISENNELQKSYKEVCDFRVSLENQLSKMQSITTDLENQLKDRPLPEDVTSLKQELEQAQILIKQMTQDHENERDNLNKDKIQLQTNIEDLQKQIAVLEDTLSSAPSPADMENVHTALNNSEANLKALKIAFQNQIENGNQEKLEQFESLVDEKEKLITENGQLIKNVAVLKQQCQNSDVHLREVETALQMKEAEILKLLRQQEDMSLAIKQRSQQLSDLETRLDKEQVSFMEQLKNSENTCASLEQQVEDLKVKSSHSDIIIAKLHTVIRESCKTNLLKLKELKQDLTDLKTQHCKLIETTVAGNRHANNECTKLQSTLSTWSTSFTERQESEKALIIKVHQLEDIKVHHETTIDEFKISLKNMSDELYQHKDWAQKLQDQLSLKEKSTQVVQESLQTVTKQLEEWKAKCDLSENNYSQLLQRYETISTKCRDAENKLIEVDSKYQNLTAAHDKCKKELEDNRTQESLIKQKLEKVKQELETKNGELESNLAITTKDLKEAMLQKTSLETELFNIQTLLSDTESKCMNFEVEVCDLQQKLIQQKDTFGKEISQLEAARDLLINQKVDLQKGLSDVQEQLKREVMSQEKARETAKQTITSLQQKATESNSQLITLQQSKLAIEQEFERMKTKYDMQVGTLQENLSTLRADLCCNQDKFQSMEKKVDELLGDKLELEAKLENALDERRAFSERCLRNEEECDKLRILTVDLRKKLDDALSALHELGRENQTLQIETAKHSNRKWANDAEVDSCKNCQKLFSVTIRKHHCRNCGDIYCNECSARTALMAAFKNPVRVCDSCFNELNNK